MSTISMSPDKMQESVRPLFIIISLLVAFLLNIMPWGQVNGVPDFVALVLLFWAIHQHRMVGIGIAFVLGLLMDVNNATFLGETALAYTLMTYFAITLHRQILWFPWSKQVWYILMLLFIPQIVPICVEYIAGGRTAGWFWIFDCVVGAILWPLVHWLLTWPQRRKEAVNHQI